MGAIFETRISIFKIVFKTFLILTVFFPTTKAYVINEEECLNYTIYPIQYELLITPFIYNDHRFYYDCDMIITVIANSPNVNIIELDAKDIEIKGNSIQVLNGENNRNIINNYRPYEFDNKKGKLYIYLNEYLRQYSLYKTQYHIKIAFTKYVNYDSRGVFAVQYYEGEPKYLFVTRFSPDKAKYFFPCFEDHQFEAIFKFRVREPPRHPSIQYTNTSLVPAVELKRTITKDNYIIIDYVPSPQISVRQVGFHYSQFGSRYVTAKDTNDTLVLWSSPTTLQYYTFILQFGQSVINLINNYATIKRPLVNGPINIVAVPSDIDGFEIDSWNLLTNGHYNLAFVPEFTSIKQLEHIMFELVQQLCRIWLGNPGEPERTRWKEEWFKEGMATYLAYYFLTQYNHGVHNMKHAWPMGKYGLEMKHKSMAVDWPHSTPALASFNRTLAVDIPSRYKDLVTMKTASILWMVESWVGTERFHRALVKYINSRRGNYISLQNFTASLDHDTVECQHQFFNGSTASKILNSWFQRPGYPVINVQVLRDRELNAIQLKQRQFSFTHNNYLESNYLIPISYLVQNNQNCFNCHQPRFTIGSTYTFEENLNGGWIILNRNASGYYRVNYDEVTWKLIANTLKEDRLSIDQQNRAQIVNDVFALYAAGDLNLELALDILDYLDNESSQIVWEAAIAGFDLLKIEGAKCEMTKTLYEIWKDFMRKKVTTIYKALVSEIEQEPKVRLFRSIIVNFASAIEYQPCLKDLRLMFNEYYNAGRSMNPDMRQACYYMLKEENNNIFYKIGTKWYEKEDRKTAERRGQEENRFLHRIPLGSPKFGSLKMPSTTFSPPSTVSPMAITTPGSSVSNMASTIFIAIVMTMLTIVR